MKKQQFLLSILVGAAAFIYLVGAFLTATFNIALWSAGQRLFAVLVYLFIAGGTFNSLTVPSENSNSKPEKEIEEEKAEAV